MNAKKKKTLWFNDFVIDNDDIIFASGSFNGLFRANFKTGRSKFLACFPGEAMDGYHLYCGTYKYGNRILFIPAGGKQFLVYDMLNQSFEVIMFRDMNRKNEPFRYKYHGSVQVGKYVYVFGHSIPEILRVDMDNLKIKLYEGWLDELYKFGRKEEAPFFFEDVCAVDDSIFAVTGQNNSIIELDTKTDKIQIHSIGEKGSIYETLAYDGEYFWLTEQAKRIVKVDKKNWSCQYKEIEKNNTIKYFVSSIVMQEMVWLRSDRLGNIIQISCKDFAIKELDILYGEPDELYPNDNAFNLYLMKKIAENELVILCVQDCQMHLFDQKGEFKKEKFLWKDAEQDYFDDALYLLYKTSGKLKITERICRNVPSNNLYRFLYFVSYADIINISVEKSFNNGNTIHTYITDMLA